MEVPKPLSIAEFLAWEARQTTNHELIDGAIVAMSNPTKVHGRLIRRLNRIIDAAVGDDCDVYLGDMTVSIGGAARDNAPRPDIAVTCDARDRRPYDASDLTIRWPKFIVEVLSPRTAAQDQGSKLRNYFTIASMEEYLIVDSRSRGLILHRRTDGQVVTTWPDERVRLDSIGAEFSIERLYGGLALSSEPV